jgi:hypothetical protein
MSNYLRLTKDEQKKIDDLAHEVNTKRIQAREKPIMDSKLLHELVQFSLEKVGVKEDGSLYYRK